MLPLGPILVEVAKAHVQVSCADVIWAQALQAAYHGSLEQIHRLLPLLLQDQQLCHEGIQCDVEGVRGTKVIIDRVSRHLKVVLCLPDLVFHEKGLNHRAVEADALRVQRQDVVEALLAKADGLVVLPDLKSYLSNISQNGQIRHATQGLIPAHLELRILQRLLNPLLPHAPLYPLDQVFVGRVPQLECFGFGGKLEERVGVFGLAERLLDFAEDLEVFLDSLSFGVLVEY